MFESLKGIILTEEAKKPQRELWIVFNEKQSQILNDLVRIQILSLFREGIEDIIRIEEFNAEKKEKIIRERQEKRHCLSVSDLVHLSSKNGKDKKLTRNQIYHHIPKLIEGGYLINFGTLTNGQRVTTYYQRTAKSIIIAAGNLIEAENNYISRLSKEIIDEYSSVFKKIFTKEEKEELSKLFAKAYSLQLKMVNDFSKQINQDVTSPKEIELLQNLIEIYSIGNSEYLTFQKRIHSILFSENK